MSECNYRYEAASRKTIKRDDINNSKLSDHMYTLTKLNHLIEQDNASNEIDDMIASGIITKKDIKALKKVAEVENVDISKIDIPEEDSDE